MRLGLGNVEKGLVGAAPLFGILLGASVLGGMADRYGRKRMFIAEMVLFTLCLVGLVASQSLSWLLVFLFGLGAALGCDYPTAHCMISESMASGTRGRLVLSAFAFQSVGALFATAVGYLVLDNFPRIDAWRYMYATAIVPAMLVVWGRFFIPDSGHWLASRGRIDEAQRAVAQLLRRRPPYPRQVRLAVSGPEAGGGCDRAAGGYRALFGPRIRRATILASVPWLLQDLGTYGIGIFTPVILSTVLGDSPGTPRNVAEIIHSDIVAAEGAAFLDLLLLCGMGCAIALAELVGRIRLQILGFIGCALGLALAAASLDAQGNPNLPLLFGGFMLFNFMLNCGPNSMTYLIAGEVFPLAVRGKGAGLAASIAKVGAVLTAFLFPLLLADIGVRILLLVLAGTSLLGGGGHLALSHRDLGPEPRTARPGLIGAAGRCASAGSGHRPVPGVLLRELAPGG